MTAFPVLALHVIYLYRSNLRLHAAAAHSIELFVLFVSVYLWVRLQTRLHV